MLTFPSAAHERTKVEKINAELNDIVDKRLNISLVTPNSGLTAAEAWKVLDRLNTTESFTMMNAISTIWKVLKLYTAQSFRTERMRLRK
jgi:hypothetical protein